jgi:hypothetical protein
MSSSRHPATRPDCEVITTCDHLTAREKLEVAKFDLKFEKLSRDLIAG